ncbi:hypothetical protein HMPREF0793_2138 [Staphylococcus caprae M23864:W1]|nr:hypothetical protein HMPREF0793_2138 [Staphylococcus caprae M23864:W1]
MYEVLFFNYVFITRGGASFYNKKVKQMNRTQHQRSIVSFASTFNIHLLEND